MKQTRNIEAVLIERLPIALELFSASINLLKENHTLEKWMCFKTFGISVARLTSHKNMVHFEGMVTKEEIAFWEKEIATQTTVRLREIEQSTKWFDEEGRGALCSDGIFFCFFLPPNIHEQKVYDQRFLLLPTVCLAVAWELMEGRIEVFSIFKKEIKLISPFIWERIIQVLAAVTFTMPPESEKMLSTEIAQIQN